MVDANAVAKIINEVAEQAILPFFNRLSPDDVREKRPGDLVTIADTTAERLLTERLTVLLPGSVVVGEESVAGDARTLELLSGTRPVWIIDPVDGTGNFAKGSPVFAVIVALVMKGQT
ncbi:MAG TPA: inositol monophosphatase, partial [Rhodospirillaceae bacterium]|nr:inositol monophosphatase [Rhodospirillaceae bacterium]